MIEEIKIDANTYRFEDGFVRFFLLEGSDKAVLIDSGMNCPNAFDIAQNLTDKPVILINTHGFSYSRIISSQVANVTTGVVMLTLRFTREYNVVAEEPMLMFATSPMASFSMSVRSSAPILSSRASV